MSLLETWRSPSTPFALDTEKALRMQIGILSPLWLPVAGAAAMGLAAWSMTRWMRLASPQGLADVREAMNTAEPLPNEPAEVTAPLAVAADPVTEAPLPLEPEVAPAPTPAATVASVATAQAAAVDPVVQAVAAPVPEAAKAAKAAKSAPAKVAVAKIAKPEPAPMPVEAKKSAPKRLVDKGAAAPKKAPGRKVRPTAH